jgi:DNA polymerase-3 subunit gamma/tau
MGDASPRRAVPQPSSKSASAKPVAAPQASIRTADPAAAPSPSRIATPVREAMVERVESTPVSMKTMDTIDLPQPIEVPKKTSATAVLLGDADAWLALVAGADLKGPTRDLAAHASFVGHADGILTLAMPDGLDHLRTSAMTGKLADALAPALGATPRIVFAASAVDGDSLHARNARQRDERQADAERAFLDNPSVQRYMQQYGAKLVPDSIRPTDEN